MTELAVSLAPAPCARCAQPPDLCVCEALAAVANHVFVLILRHPAEARAPLATAEIAAAQLRHARVVTGLSWSGLKRALGREDDPRRWGVLYLGAVHKLPRTGAALVAVDKAGAPLPDQKAALAGLGGIVVLDGSWSQAKALWWRNPWLLKLRRLVVNPPAPGAFGKARREPRPLAVSTLEAAAYALGDLEEDKTLPPRLIAPLHLLVKKHARISAPTARRVR
jgi:DTW domain-containing protein